MSGCVHQVAVHEHCSKTVWDRFVLAHTPDILRVFCSDGFPYVIAPAFSTPAFSAPAIYSCIFHSCIFHPCYLLLLFPLLHFPLPHFHRPHCGHNAVNTNYSLIGWHLSNLRRILTGVSQTRKSGISIFAVQNFASRRRIPLHCFTAMWYYNWTQHIAFYCMFAKSQ